jgi:hypothetical protein
MARVSGKPDVAFSVRGHLYCPTKQKSPLRAPKSASKREAIEHLQGRQLGREFPSQNVIALRLLRPPSEFRAPEHYNHDDPRSERPSELVYPDL